MNKIIILLIMLYSLLGCGPDSNGSGMPESNEPGQSSEVYIDTSHLSGQELDIALYIIEHCKAKGEDSYCFKKMLDTGEIPDYKVVNIRDEVLKNCASFPKEKELLPGETRFCQFEFLKTEKGSASEYEAKVSIIHIFGRDFKEDEYERRVCSFPLDYCQITRRFPYSEVSIRVYRIALEVRYGEPCNELLMKFNVCNILMSITL